MKLESQQNINFQKEKGAEDMKSFEVIPSSVCTDRACTYSLSRIKTDLTWRYGAERLILKNI